MQHWVTCSWIYPPHICKFVAISVRLDHTMTDYGNTFSALLASNGYSNTKQRQILFKLLSGQEPMSMHDICVAARGSMDRASVYRTIAIFEQIGVVRRINIGWKYKIELSDTFAEHHHHLSCLRCKKIIPINEQALESFVDKVAAAHEFQPTEHQIEIQGYCSICRQII